jgi:hypothetical protein
VVVFVLLGVIWAAVLVPPWLQSRRDARPIASMRSFRSQLWSLERATPTYSDGYGADDDALDTYGAHGGFGAYGAYGSYDVDDIVGDGEIEDGDMTTGTGVHALRPARRTAAAVLGTAALAPGVVGAAVRSASDASTPGVNVRAAAVAHRRAIAFRRRRQVLTVLVLLAGAGAAPALLLSGPWLVVEAVAATLLVGYLSLLIRKGRREAERAQKVRYLTPIRAPRPAVVVFGSGAAR